MREPDPRPRPAPEPAVRPPLTDVGSTPVPSWLAELQIEAGPPWHAMGTRALDESRWLAPDDERDVQLAQKRDLLDHARGDVVVTGPGVEAACSEVAQLVSVATGEAPDPSRPPLEGAALLVQEDLCVLVRHDGVWRLEAGVVCFPSMWRVADKLGLPVTAVHGPVPGYADELAGRVDRFLDRLRPDHPVWRRNWLVHDSPELHLTTPPVHRGAPEVPGGLWLRSERQTLRRLPVSDAILFTIRTQQAPFAVVAARPPVAAGIARAVRSWSVELVTYRNAAAWREPVLVWLDEVTAEQA